MKNVVRLHFFSVQLLSVCIVLLVSTAAVYAEDLTFTWTANPEPVTGYKLYYKIGADSSPPYNGVGLVEGSSPILIDKVTTFTVTGRDTGEIYHFALTAYNDEAESGYTSLVTVDPLGLEDTPPVINLIRMN